MNLSTVFTRDWLFHFPLPQHAASTARPEFSRELGEKWLQWGRSFVVGYKMK